ncbi:hypothetical protein H0H92_011743 [Tricholoma furcatifolium]|nr:hypothetical protein H0H92_011743 [Tricholoma furcatifolium]
MKMRSGEQQEQHRSASRHTNSQSRTRAEDVDSGEERSRPPQNESTSGERQYDELRTEGEEIQAEKENWNGPRSSWKESQPQLTVHLNHLFPELHFPDEVAKRILTHGSHPSAIYGHNGAFSFIGRRVLESYLLLMLNSSPALKKTSIPIDEIVARTLNSYTLGEFVGSKWGLGRAMRWTPSVAAPSLNKGLEQGELLRSVGLYKVQGDAVSAVVGGVFFQFGGSVAHRLFHTRILPLLVGNGLPETFNHDAMAACKRMGGKEGKLLVKEKLEQVS